MTTDTALTDPPEIPSVPNLRDLGGYPTRDGGRVRRGLVYRSSELSALHGKDLAAFAQLGIRAVYDLRGELERAAHPDRLPPGTIYVVADVVADSSQPTPGHLMAIFGNPDSARQAFGDGKSATFFIDAYREFVTLPSACRAYGKLFSDISEEGHRPALFHCTTGKDRTGWAAAALLMLLGVPDEIVLEDFLRSRTRLEPLLKMAVEEFRARGGDPELLGPLMDVRPEYLDSAIREMRRAFGSVERYFSEGLGVDDAAQRRLREALVEPS
jgi:protein-tyrosine phosphatase